MPPELPAPDPSSIALVHDWLTVPAGSEEVFREMCGLFPGVVFTSLFEPSRFPWLEGREVRTSFLQRLSAARRRHHLAAPILPPAYRSFDLSQFDLVLSSSHSFAHGVRKAPGALHVCYYHTPARSLWVPEVDPRASRTFVHRAIARNLKRQDLAASRGVDVALANSRTTAERIRRFYGREAQVVYPPVHVGRWVDTPCIDQDLGYLYWGRLIAYKRIDLLIDAARRRGFPLQIVGSGPMEAALRERAAGLANVAFHGRLDDDALKRVMSRCRAFLFAAYEDFGIVAVEAMAAGLPVVALSEGGASESVTSKTGVLMREQSVEALLDAIEELESRAYDRAMLRERAWEFDVAVFRERYQQAVHQAWKTHRRAS